MSTPTTTPTWSLAHVPSIEREFDRFNRAVSVGARFGPSDQNVIDPTLDPLLADATIYSFTNDRVLGVQVYPGPSPISSQACWWYQTP